MSSLKPNQVVIRNCDPLCSLTIITNSNEVINHLGWVDNEDLERQELKQFQLERDQRDNIKGNLPNIKSYGSLTSEKLDDIKSLLLDNALAFSADKSDLGRVGYYRFQVPLIEKQAIAYEPSRPIPPGIKGKVDAEIEKWKEAKLIEKSSSSFNLPMLIIKKPDLSIRICLDARKLNAISIPDRFPLPSLLEKMSQIGRKLKTGNDVYISQFDIKRAYSELRLADEDRPKVAFSYNDDHYQSTRLVYRLMGGPSAWCRLMREIFSTNKDIHCFIDDLKYAQAHMRTM